MDQIGKRLGGSELSRGTNAYRTIDRLFMIEPYDRTCAHVRTMYRTRTVCSLSKPSTGMYKHSVIETVSGPFSA